ncbi:MAG TPA: hypothetical protein VGO68_17830 [Pyrinomonadaceae bacterium]|jgi:hypothetical protein|nr:hypothetical protein [Pyrinomonadaceae bacterium]
MILPSIQRRLIQVSPALFLFAVLFVLTVNAQQPRPLDQTAPPPAKVITREERSQLNQSKDEKARIKLTLALAESHLTNAENHTSQQQFEGAASEAGMYWALIEDAFAFMKTLTQDTNRRRDLYKRLELSLRAHGPRWSTVRRNTPAEYAVWIKELEEFARNGRTEALNSFYGNTVLHEDSQKATDPKEIVKPLEKH